MHGQKVITTFYLYFLYRTRIQLIQLIDTPLQWLIQKDKTMTLPQILTHYRERAIARLLRRLGATSTETNVILRRRRLFRTTP